MLVAKKILLVQGLIRQPSLFEEKYRMSRRFQIMKTL